MTKIYVDADACPVKDSIITAAIRHDCQTFMVCNGGIRPHPHPRIELVIVTASADAADIWIAEHISAEDILVTNDIPLAEKCVHSGAIVLKPDGKILDSHSIGGAVATRVTAPGASTRSRRPPRTGGRQATRLFNTRQIWKLRPSASSATISSPRRPRWSLFSWASPSAPWPS